MTDKYPDAPDCPFCGSTDLLDGDWYLDDEEVDAIECEQCKAGAPASVWNQRRDPWRRTAQELPKPGQQVLLMSSERYWSVPEGVPESNVSATGYYSEASFRGYWAVFGERGMELAAFDLWMPVPLPEGEQQ